MPADTLPSPLRCQSATMRLITPEACTPFGARVGTTLAEGAAFVVLEDEGRARARGARVRAIVEGEGSRADAFHPTSPHPSGDGLAGALAPRVGIADAVVHAHRRLHHLEALLEQDAVAELEGALVELFVLVGLHQHVRQDRNRVPPFDHGLDVAEAFQKHCAFDRRFHSNSPSL